MSGCEHLDFEANVSVGRITDGEAGPVTQFVADVTVKCSECGEDFGFRGSPGGFSWDEPRCQVDAKAISLPLMSPSELELAGPLPAFARGPMTINVYPTEQPARLNKAADEIDG